MWHGSREPTRTANGHNVSTGLFALRRRRCSPILPILTRAERSTWLRLRTLILLLWLTVFGQSATVLVAAFGLGLDLPLGLCFAALGAAALFNARGDALPRARRPREGSLKLR